MKLHEQLVGRLKSSTPCEWLVAVVVASDISVHRSTVGSFFDGSDVTSSGGDGTVVGGVFPAKNVKN